jgi:hypothetical protein
MKHKDRVEFVGTSGSRSIDAISSYVCYKYPAPSLANM